MGDKQLTISHLAKEVGFSCKQVYTKHSLQKTWHGLSFCSMGPAAFDTR